MDTDLFQWLAAGLLAAIAVLLILAITTLGRIRRALEEGGAERRAAATHAEVISGAGSPSTSAEATAAPEDAQVDAARIEAATADEAIEDEREPAREDRDVAAASAASARATEAAHEEATHDETDDEPQEQPFERDGRWWFRRGDELLVYDEGTGQWLQAPGSGAGPVSGSPSEGASATASEVAVATETRTSVATEATAEELSDVSQEGSSAFWKCPACGAVNGSTATSCRMCFSARP